MRRGGLTVALMAGALTLSGCASMSTLDWDLRPSAGFSTSDAARAATAARPAPDARGVISYPGYQVVVAQRGERVADIASRLGLDPGALARHNAIGPDATLRGGELLVLPSRVSEPEGLSSGAITTTPLGPGATAPSVAEPVRHTVERGESAFTIARLYNVTPRALADWNGLPADMSVREGQILMIPVATQTIAQAAAGAPLNAAGVTAAETAPATTSQPGQGSPTPVPPSAATPLPASNPARSGETAGTTAATPPVADMGAQRTEGPRLAMPVQGRIIRAYAQGRNEGIGIGAPEGTDVHAAAAGTVAAITQDTDQVPIMVIRHENNLLTVYANIDNIRVARGDRVSRGQSIATVRHGDPSFLHFEVREGFDSVDPMPYLQ
ncbi:MAG: peptidoglycan DD-metalloendopeptidase family protein [Rhodobacter sp.]|nr:peptidoglycan DD-metalloendopeptidase family protein [Paracoccaceae bacterium]MCC0074730.1 peptidoglycan DD-metalloendopeptidase family protein [Rhodobacter sp.]